MHIFTHTHTHTHTHTYIYIYTHARAHTHTHTLIAKFIFICVWKEEKNSGSQHLIISFCGVCVCVCVCVCLCVCHYLTDLPLAFFCLNTQNTHTQWHGKCDFKRSWCSTNCSILKQVIHQGLLNRHGFWVMHSMLLTVHILSCALHYTNSQVTFMYKWEPGTVL